MKWVQLYSTLNIIWHCPSLRFEWKQTDLFQPCGHCWVSQICWWIECSTLPLSSFRIWNSSAGIPSPPLALFIVMLPKTHLTSHSRISCSRWVTAPSWLSKSLGLFCTVFLPSVLNHNHNAVHDEKIKVEEMERYPGPGHQIWVKVCVPLQRSENGGLLYPHNYKDYKLRPPYNMTSCVHKIPAQED